MSLPPLPPPLGNYRFSPRPPGRPGKYKTEFVKIIFVFSAAGALAAGALITALLIR